jgi:hypothetical protein
VSFRKTDAGLERLPTIVEGPLVSLVTSDQPTEIVLSLRLDVPAPVTVILGDERRIESEAADSHVLAVKGLTPATEYTYRVAVGTVETPAYRFRTAPKAGAGPVTFAYCGDSREGVGGGMETYMGTNYLVAERIAAASLTKGAEFFLMGGDLINGYTNSKKDFVAQLYAWKQAMSGFWHERPVYTTMGNHEALLRVFKSKRGPSVRIDRWPYATHSAEAAFTEEFINPTNAPEPSDPRRPSYRESVFSFRYGLLAVIAFNNNYWFGSHPAKYGGAPEGYILDDQLRWIEAELRKAEADPAVRYSILFTQEPVFPCGGHLKDAMWYHGDNRVRAHTFRDGKLVPEPQGMLEVRNRLTRLVANSPKAAAVLCSDEHAFHRVFIDKAVPVGDPERDDKNGDGRIAWPGETASPLEDLPRGVWFVTCGGGGAPYFAEEPAPWNAYWKAQDEPGAGYRYTSLENFLMFHADEQRIEMRVLSPYGQEIDRVENLMAGRK